MTLETMIENLSLEEKLTALELIWRDLSAEPNSFPSPEWHGDVIADRLATPSPGQSLPLNEAKQIVIEAINARRTPN
ncbi:MAG: addiction module protein [Planctomycetaceae bacterium]